MTYFHKLPFLLSAFMAVLVGTISFALGTDNQAVYLHMVITMVVFYVIGLYARKTLQGIREEIDLKNAEAEKEKERMLQEEKEKELREAAEKGHEPFKGQSINLTAEDADDGFEPLTVSRVIAGKMNQ